MTPSPLVLACQLKDTNNRFLLNNLIRASFRIWIASLDAGLLFSSRGTTNVKDDSWWDSNPEPLEPNSNAIESLESPLQGGRAKMGKCFRAIYLSQISYLRPLFGFIGKILQLFKVEFQFFSIFPSRSSIIKLKKCLLLCCPVFCPQMVGMVCPLVVWNQWRKKSHHTKSQQGHQIRWPLKDEY